METLRLGELAAKIGETERQIQRVVDEGLAPQPEKKGQYDIWKTIRGVIRYYKDKASKVSELRIANAARKEDAEATIVEIELAEKRGRIHQELERMIADYALKTRTVIGGAEYLVADQRRRLVSELVDIERPKPKI